MTAIKYKTKLNNENLTIGKKHFIVSSLLFAMCSFIIKLFTSCIPSHAGTGFYIPIGVLLDGIVFGTLWHLIVLTAALREYIKGNR